MYKPRKSYALWITGHILRLIATLIVAAVCFCMLWRVFISSIPPAAFKQLAPNDALAEAYRTHGEDLQMFTQEQGTVTRSEKSAGYFGYTMATFIPDAKQLQVVFRYNNSTLKYIQQDFALEEQPLKGVLIFDVTLTTIFDTTPDDKTDNVDGSPNLAKVRTVPTSHEIDTTLLYTYVRYTFDNVEMTEDAITAFLDVYYEADVNYDAEPLGTLRLYHVESPNLAVKLTSKEKKALDAYQS